VHAGAVVTQAPFEQTSPIAAQLVHDFPPMPHTVALVPPWQAPFESQQPEQVPALQGWEMQDPPWQAAPVVAQFWQLAPPVPQAFVCPPSAHTPPWQQPVHVTGPHVASQEPFTHCVPAPHTAH